MNRISIHLLTNIVLLLAGLLLIVFHGQADLLNWVARVLGVMFVVPSVAYLAVAARPIRAGRTGNDYLGALPAVGGLCFGIVLLAHPQLFADALSICMGVLLIALGMFHVIYLLLSRNDMRVRPLHYLLPLAVVVCGALILGVDRVRADRQTVVIVTGVCLLLFNITSLQEHKALRRARRNAPLYPRIEDDDDTSKNSDDDPQNQEYLHVEV